MIRPPVIDVDVLLIQSGAKIRSKLIFNSWIRLLVPPINPVQNITFPKLISASP